MSHQFHLQYHQSNNYHFKSSLKIITRNHHSNSSLEIITWNHHSNSSLEIITRIHHSKSSQILTRNHRSNSSLQILTRIHHSKSSYYQVSLPKILTSTQALACVPQLHNINSKQHQARPELKSFPSFTAFTASSCGAFKCLFTYQQHTSSQEL